MLLFHISDCSFHVFDQKVFACQLIMVPKMVYLLGLCKMDLIKDLVNPMDIGPVKVPFSFTCNTEAKMTLFQQDVLSF